MKADLATYGKVVGGGMPIGVLAGSATYMDALDGGFWQYGDDSSPPTGVTFFAGTFVRHPLAMAAAHAVLKHLKAAGPALQERTNQLTARFVEKVNDFFQGRQLPMKLQDFSAMFYYDFHSDLKYAGLLFYYLRDRGVHIWEGRVGHLSVAHTDEDMDRVLQAFQESVEEMQSGGFLPESGSDTAATGCFQNRMLPNPRVSGARTDGWPRSLGSLPIPAGGSPARNVDRSADAAGSRRPASCLHRALPGRGPRRGDAAASHPRGGAAA